jgi:sodium-dependent dicarboxylate transporter 2/3/5
MLALSLCYSANVGGTATIIGTPGNLVFMETLDSSFKDHPVTFISWMAFALPQVKEFLG